MTVAVSLELLSLSLIYYFLNLILSQSEVSKNIFLSRFNFSETQFQIFASVFLLIIYSIKTCYLVFYAYIINKFSFSLEAKISEKLFNSYLKRNYIDFIKTNTSEYIQIIIKETITIVFSFFFLTSASS